NDDTFVSTNFPAWANFTGIQLDYYEITWSFTNGGGFTAPDIDFISFSVDNMTGPVATPTISITDATLTEGDSGTETMDFTVSLNAASTGTVTVFYCTSNNSATAGSDYEAPAANSSLNFAPGEISKTISVTITGDTLIEGNETFSVNLTDAVGGTISDGVGTGTITNDDVNSAPFSRDITSFLTLGASSGAQTAAGTVATTAIDNITLEAWVYLDNTTGAHHLLFNGNGGNNGYGLYISGGTINVLMGSVGWIVCSTGGSYNSANASVLQAGEWTHVVATRNSADGGTDGWKMYVNGQALATQFNTAGGANGTPRAMDGSSYIQIGSSAYDPSGLSVSEARIWAKALTQAEIQANMAGSVATNAANLAGYWKLDQTSGATFNDVRTNGTQHNLTGTGAITWTASTSGATNEDTVLSGILSGGDLETDVTYAVTQPSHGTVSVNAATGAYTYTPSANYNGSDSFTFTVNDGAVASAPRTVNLAVTAMNDAPVITSNGGDATAAVSVAENTTAVAT
ncbi:MAG: hypothetical protein EOL86_14785, partial [Deltaproteobacteria bacterium]|nr:hypothetical protein [Deltaproteobacteria bacterium]